MNEQDRPPFLALLESGVERGGFETDDVLACFLPLMRQVLAAHQAGQVAPLGGIGSLVVTEQGLLMFKAERAGPPKRNRTTVDRAQRSTSEAVEVVANSQRTADLDQGSLSVTDLDVGSNGTVISKPVFLPGYQCWEHEAGHHDEISDVFSLGQLLASLACGLDFTQAADLEEFSRSRTNLFRINARLNPVLASVIVQMTELNRHKRAPDLGSIITRLEQYREQRSDLDFNNLPGFRETALTGKRRIIQSRLRDRLFDISRRNRLVYFKQSLHTLNLSVASVPLLMDFKNIKLEHLFVWHPQLAATVTEGAPMSLGKYLRFEDAPYIAGVLDKIISEARRDSTEFGFAQLRLVLCFLRWNNLKEEPSERIHSPLLLLPVELSRKKGVRDQYVLDPSTSEAEVNPALRHHLKELYNLQLPEMVDLKQTTLEQFHAALQAQIQTSEPGVTLNLVDRPRIELIHEKARQRMDQHSRRMKVNAKRARSAARPEYSYDRERFQPLGLQLFAGKVRPTPIPLRNVAGAPPQRRSAHMVEPGEPAEHSAVVEAERQSYALLEADNQNPYSWDFDLCNLTLGNFNYRKMTLVRDYANLVETDMASAAFDAVFSLSPKIPEEVAPPGRGLADQHPVVSYDATQAAAISRARTGASYIIQGPPGTGKSQTITNLIADYVARGKRVLFVCEKRAAIDVVFHRLKQQGLDELCCLIHDSQTDKKAFIQNLKQTYEKFLSQADLDPAAEAERTACLQGMGQDLEALRRYSDVMGSNHPRTGVPVRSLLHRLVMLRGQHRDAKAETEDILPEYPVWLRHGDVVERLKAALAEVGGESCFSMHPIRWLGREVLQADRPLETLAKHLDEAENLMDQVGGALELSGLPGELWDSFEEIGAIIDFAVRADSLAERKLLGVLSGGPEATAFQATCQELDARAANLAKARQRTKAWRQPLSPEDTRSALAVQQSLGESIFRLVQPAFWRLRKTLRARYDFSQHAVAPGWSQILGDLEAQHRAQEEFDQAEARARTAWLVDDTAWLRAHVEELRGDRRSDHPSVKHLLSALAGSTEAASTVQALKRLSEPFARLDATLRSLLAEHSALDFDKLALVLTELGEQSGVLAELSPILSELADLPAGLNHALRHSSVPLADFEAAIAQKSIGAVYRDDRAVSRFDGRVLARRLEGLQRRHREWLGLNARCVRAAVRQNFLEHVAVSSLPASQLEASQKAFKKTYAAGRKELEHEFGKSMRYRSIRDLAAGDTGRVIQDLKPVWLMSPLSVSDTLPLDPNLFDAVIFDEASQIPVEEAVPAIYRSQQAIVVGDEMQLPPTTFFAGTRTDGEDVLTENGEGVEMDLEADSFLTQSAINLPSTLLAWHYRSRHEALISFSNAAFYGGNLFTVPDRQRALIHQKEILVSETAQGAANVDELLARSISFHFMENGVYEDRRNASEAGYIAVLVRGLLERDTKLSIGVVAFSEAQQGEIESAMEALAADDKAFGARLEAEYGREENDVFCGLFVKNLENVQGDERDIIIMSVCYGHDPDRRMLMNFGPINQRGGEKRLNVIFSRARHHMAIVSSIRHSSITNDHNDGANSLKNFLHYAEAVSAGDGEMARRILEGLNPLGRKALAPSTRGDMVVNRLADALRARGYVVELNVGQSKFRCDIAVRNPSDSMHQLAVLIDTEAHYATRDLMDRYLIQPGILSAFGWRVMMVLTKDWYHAPSDVLNRIEKALRGSEPEDAEDGAEPESDSRSKLEGAQPMPPATDGVHSRSPVNPTAAASRYFELVSGPSKKFWEIHLQENSLTVRFGRIGTEGQSQTKSFADGTKASREAARLVEEKVRKGYQERERRGAN